MQAKDRRPACSVVIPCFNAGATIRSTLESARRQTVADIEIIVVDDGSRDHGPEIVASIAAIDPRIQLIRQPNAGVSSARNAAIAVAKSNFVALLDSDDMWTPDHLRIHLQRIAADPRLGISYASARFVDTQGVVVGRSRPHPGNLTPADLLQGNPTTTCSTLVIRRSVFKDVGMFRTDMRFNEDQEWLFRVALSGWGMSNDPRASVDYRTSPGGLASDLDGMYQGFLTMLLEARKLAPGLVQRHAAHATANMNRYLARRAIRLGLAPHIARRYMIASIRSCPSVLLLEPRATLPTLAAALLPKALITSVLQMRRRSPVHA